MIKYTQNVLRRQDRLLSEERALELMRTAEHGFLSMVDEEGRAYGVPVNFIYDGDSSIYLHCAPEGRKLRAIAAHPQVSFCIVGATHIIPHKFTTNYESVVLDCLAHTRLDERERHRALELLIDKYSPEFKEIGLKYTEKSFFRTEIIRLDIITASGKAKNIPD